METPEKIGSTAVYKATSIDRRVCAAPMMDYTDRHFRYLLRLLNPTALLYTEMVNAQALLRGDAERHLACDELEHPLALQLGGNEPRQLAAAARIALDYGYAEINLNCGCPSDRVQSGRFGACLMAEPQLVAECVAALRDVVPVPVTVKCRIGIEPRPVEPADDFQFLRNFVAAVTAAGCDVLVLHARKAMLNGLSPKQNRSIPPLRFDVAAQLRAEFPGLALVVNGGIRTVVAAQEVLRTFDGVMLGRELCDNPYRLAELYAAIVDPQWMPPTRAAVVACYTEYMHARAAEGHPVAAMLRRALPLFAGQPGARSWRRLVGEQAALTQPKPDILLAALRMVMPVPQPADRLSPAL
jgi:tRNA-dihydrouridine synthase A